MDEKKIVLIKLQGGIAVEFERQRTELETKAREEEPGASFPPHMFISYLLDIRQAAASAIALDEEQTDDN